MDKIRAGFHYIFSSYKRTAGVLFIGGLMLAIPLTLSLVRQTQDVRQRASSVCTTAPADIMLVMDKSLSMNDKVSASDSATLLEKSQDAANGFVDTISANTSNRVGLVSYSSESQTNLDSPLTNNFADVKDEIDDLDAGGGTCIQCGIKKANAEITTNKTNNKNVVILLTDGKANLASGSNNENQTTAEAGALSEVADGVNVNQTVYYTIGLGNVVNTSFLQNIANQSGGQYYAAPNANDLAAIYQQISQVLGRGSVTGVAFDDVNGNTTLDANEPKMGGLLINLKDANDIILNSSTDNAGAFSFSGICDGQYVLSPTLPSGVNVLSPVGGNYNIIIAGGNSVSDRDFALTEATTLTGTVILTPIPTASGTPSGTLTPTPTASQSATSLNMYLQLSGIGISTNSALRINDHPQRPQRRVHTNIYNSNNVQVASISSNVNFDPETGLYKGNITLSNNFPSGPYLVKVRVDNTLWKNIPGIQNIVSGTTNESLPAQLITGDLNQDNVINLLDYNIFLSCYQGQCATNLTSANIKEWLIAFDITNDKKRIN